MRIFSAEEERKLFGLEAARGWRRSGLISAEQLFMAEFRLGPVLARAGASVRLLFFLFTGLALFSANAFIASNIPGHFEQGLFFSLSSVPCYALGEWLLRRYRVHRFGVEEALLLGAGSQFALGVFLLFLDALKGSPWAANLALGVPAVLAALWLYARFGYLYAGFAAAGAAACVLFSLRLPQQAARLSLAVVYAASLFAMELREDVPDFEKRDWETLQAVLCLGIYLSFHLRLARIFDFSAAVSPSGAGFYYWNSFAAVCVLPSVVMAWGLCARKRAAIIAGALMAILTLMTWKLYVGWERHVWDAAVFGAALAATAALLAWWLDSGTGGERGGYTAKPLILPREEGLEAGAIAAAAVAAAAAPAAPCREKPSFGGGESGGGGATASF